jgi:hypothetical protein
MRNEWLTNTDLDANCLKKITKKFKQSKSGCMKSLGVRGNGFCYLNPQNHIYYLFISKPHFMALKSYKSRRSQSCSHVGSKKSSKFLARKAENEDKNVDYLKINLDTYQNDNLDMSAALENEKQHLRILQNEMNAYPCMLQNYPPPTRGTRQDFL